MSRRLRRLLSIVAATGLVLAPSSGAAPSLAFTGYQSEGSPTALVTRDAPVLSEIGVDGITLSGDGVGPVDPSAQAQLAAARAAGRPATLLVSNYSDRINDFSEALARGLLLNADRVANTCAELRADVLAQGWSGITLDMESLSGRDAAAYVRFVRTLRGALPAGTTLSIDVSDRPSLASYLAGGYDLRGLAPHVDEVVLMAYDQHGTWEGAPGPVGAIGWQLTGLRAMLQAIPRRELTLGVAGYGYRWSPHLRSQVSDREARRLAAAAGVTPRFDQRAEEWTARLGDGTVLWWADGRSLALRADLARRMGLRGLALWSLGLADPLGPLTGVHRVPAETADAHAGRSG